MSLPELDLVALRGEIAEVVQRYPQPRSALMPILHLVQAHAGYVTADGIELCAEVLGLTEAEVSAVATFYTMYKRHPMGEYHVGVCTNTLCAVMGGDAIWSALTEHTGLGHDEVSADGRLSLERVECNAACDYAPVVMVNWEFFDNQTVGSAVGLVDDLRAGVAVRSTRGPRVCTFRQAERVLAGFPDGLASHGPAAGPASLAGLELAHERGWQAPAMPGRDGDPGADGRAGSNGRRVRTGDSGGAATSPAPGAADPDEPVAHSGHDAPDQTAGSDPDSPADPAGPARGPGPQDGAP